MTIKTTQLKQKSTDLNLYDHFAEEHDIISVTDWQNGEGFDIDIDSKNRNQHFSLTYGEYTALTTLWNYVEGKE